MSIAVIPYTSGPEDDAEVPDSPVHHPSAMRNRGPITRKLQHVLSSAGLLGEGGEKRVAVEVASGTGCHLEAFAKAFPTITWQPSEYIPMDVVAESEQSSKIGAARPFDGDRDRTLALIDEVGSKSHDNVCPAVAIDASLPWKEWPPDVQSLDGQVALVFAANVTHISPWETSLGIIGAGGKLLGPTGRLVIYGPFKKDGKFTTESNQRFDTSLRGRDPRWGYRDVESELVPEAERNGLSLLECHEMPANNFLLSFGRTNPPL